MRGGGENLPLGPDQGTTKRSPSQGDWAPSCCKQTRPTWAFWPFHAFTRNNVNESTPIGLQKEKKIFLRTHIWTAKMLCQFGTKLKPFSPLEPKNHRDPGHTARSGALQALGQTPRAGLSGSPQSRCEELCMVQWYIPGGQCYHITHSPTHTKKASSPNLGL